MKKILLGIALAILFTSNLSALQQYWKKPTDWKLFTKEKGEISEYFSGGVTISGDGMKVGYKLDLLPLNKGATIIHWAMNFSDFYAIYIEIDTTKGKRTLRYTSFNNDIGKKGKYISFGLGSSSRNGQYQEITRDLQHDLEKFERGNKVLSINTFMVRGSGVIDNIRTELIDNVIKLQDTDNDPNAQWSIFTTTKGIIRTSDYMYGTGYRYGTHQSGEGQYAIKLSGKGMKTGYKLSFPPLNSDFKTIEWGMKYSEDYAIYFLVNTSNGVKYLRYSSLNYDKGKHGKYISFGLGSASKDGKWHQFRRNLQKDLNKFEPNNKILSINAFIIRGSGLVGDIQAIKDSYIAPIKNFNMKKFNELLNEETKSGRGVEFTRLNINDEHIKAIIYREDGFYEDLVFYTLSSDQTKLREIVTFEQSIVLDYIKFNSDHTKMIFGQKYGSKPTDIVEYEILL